MLKRTYNVLNEIFISEKSLIHNYTYFQQLNPHATVAPVLKSNAYGHGLKEIAQIVENHIKPSFVCVDSLYEAYILEKNFPSLPVLIMGYTLPENYQVWKKLPFRFSVTDIPTLKALNKHQPGARIHIKLDTGMCRLGLQPHDIPEFIQALKQCTRLEVEGIYSHLSQADDVLRPTFTKKQVELFKTMTARFEAAGFSFTYRHIAATAGASYIQDPYFNLIRLGIGLFGISPFGPHTKLGRDQREVLQPVLTLKSHIAQIKIIPPGSQVSYGGTYTAKQQETIGILPIGYQDGLSRDLSNQGGVMLENGTICPIIGRICMNMTIIKIPRTTSAKVGDAVIVISSTPTAPNSIYRLCQQIDTISYTIMTGLHSSTRRVII